MLSTATLANVGFSQAVQLFAHHQTQLTQKIPFINSEKNFWGVNNVRKNIRV